MILSDRDIKSLITYSDPDHAREGSLIRPFSATKVNMQGPSYGLSSHGYDVRLGTAFIELPEGSIIPGQEVTGYTEIKLPEGRNYYLASGGFVLACSYEKITLPANITGLVKDKSSYARLGVCVQNTVLEAGWQGIVTLEISNHGPAGVYLLPGKGIAQILFFRSKGCDVPYFGKYQGDTTVVPSK